MVCWWLSSPRNMPITSGRCCELDRRSRCSFSLCVVGGFRPGGLNVPVGLGTPAAFNAEKLTNYELGWKNTSLEGHLRTQIDAFCP